MCQSRQMCPILSDNNNGHHVLILLKLTSTIGCIDLHKPHHSAANWMTNNRLLSSLHSFLSNSVWFEIFGMVSDSNSFRFKSAFNSLDDLISTIPPSLNSSWTRASKSSWCSASTLLDARSTIFKDWIKYIDESLHE